MPDPLSTAVEKLLSGRELTSAETEAAVLHVMEGGASPIALGMFLAALRLKGESVDEIVGAATALRSRVVPIRTNQTGLLDTCGTGGDGLNTFNISTAAAIVTAACGVPVAKHGNRGFSSRSGSADVLEAFGVRIDLSADDVGRCIDEIGIGFCFAPAQHQAMKHAAAVRRELGFRTIFNLLGPLTNPADAPLRLIGTYRVELAEKLAAAMLKLGTTRSLVLCGNDELDEASLWGETTIFDVHDGKVHRSTIDAARFGLPECRVADLAADTPAASARIISDLLDGHRGPALDITLANAALALVTAGKADDPAQGVEIARGAVESGRGRQMLARLASWTNAAK